MTHKDDVWYMGINDMRIILAALWGKAVKDTLYLTEEHLVSELKDAVDACNHALIRGEPVSFAPLGGNEKDTIEPKRLDAFHERLMDLEKGVGGCRRALARHEKAIRITTGGWL